MEFIRKIKHKKRVNRLISEAVLQQIEVLKPLNEEKSLQAIGLINEFDKHMMIWGRLEARIHSLEKLLKRGPKDRFLRDSDGIRDCPSNVAKMTLIEAVYYGFNLKYYFNSGIEAIKVIAAGIAFLFVIITTPIWIIYSAAYTRKRARLEVDRCNKHRRAQRRREFEK